MKHDYNTKIRSVRNFLAQLRRNTRVPMETRIQAAKLSLELLSETQTQEPPIHYTVKIGGLPDTSGRHSPVGIERCISFLEDMKDTRR
jgi:hypothetical protein